MDQPKFQSLLEDLHLGKVAFLESTTSTNDIAMEWVAQGAPHWSVIATDHQTSGRGRSGRTWYTLPGTSLAFSIILRPQINFQYYGRFTALGAIGVCNTLNKIISTKARIKWPNDVLLQGEKTAGILTEIVWKGNQPEAIVIGIGVNIEKNSVPPDVPLNYPATYVAAHTQSNPNRFRILLEILAEIKIWYPMIDSPSFIDQWESLLAFRGEQVIALITSPDESSPSPTSTNLPISHQNSIHGKIVGLTQEGLLSLELESGQIQHFAANEIRILTGE